ncbi:iron hydrogenase [Hysterangium stoloniferum]|nr:iron hydrogenase [Hysterangium stoloniferum]
MAFSGALTLSDLNDFLSPSQACIKPVEDVKPAEQPADPGAAATQISIDSSGNYYEITARKTDPSAGKKLQTAQISLNDCLACSGCITSAESVLITMQSHEEVLSFLSSNPSPDVQGHRIPIISISPQSLASLAASVSSTSSQTISLQTVLQRIRVFCRQQLGFAHVYDTTFARHLSLLEQGREYTERKAATGQGDNKLPMLASACPGWICYAEKAHSEMLPFISRTKSPQQIMGSLIKEWMSKKWEKTPGDIYHVSVMPCYDKKLEASRQDFFNDVYNTRDVDCVITTGELELLMREKGWDLSIRVDGEDAVKPELVTQDFSLPELLLHPGTSSGSYLQSIISLVSSSQENTHRTLKLNTRTIRTADYEEYVLEDITTGEVVFKGAKCYGFRNLQNVVRKIGKENGVRGLPGGAVRGRVKRRLAEGQTASQDKGYDFVEVMACPSGCVNGGGQIRPPIKVLGERVLDAEGYQREWAGEGVQPEADVLGLVADPSTKWGNKDWIQKVESNYWSSVDPSADSASALNADHAAVHVLKEMCNLRQDTDLPADNRMWMQSMESKAEARRREIFRTNYRKIDNEVVGLAVKW